MNPGWAVNPNRISSSDLGRPDRSHLDQRGVVGPSGTGLNGAGLQLELQLEIRRWWDMISMMCAVLAGSRASCGRTHLSLPDLPVCLDPPRSGSGPATEGQARLRVSVHRSSFLDHEMPTVTDGLEPEDPACWACLGRGRREDQASSATYGFAVHAVDHPGAECPRRRHGSFKKAAFQRATTPTA